MPNMDGAGPRFACRRNGRPFKTARTAVGCSFGRGRGFCRFTDVNNKESLTATKAALQRDLADVEMLLQRSE